MLWSYFFFAQDLIRIYFDATKNVAHKKDSHQAVFFNVLAYHKLNYNCVYLRCVGLMGRTL